MAASSFILPLISCSGDAGGGGSSLAIPRRAAAAAGGRSSTYFPRREGEAPAGKKGNDYYLWNRLTVTYEPLLKRYTPWLTLPPAYEFSDVFAYRFYFIAEQQDGSIHKITGTEKEKPEDDAETVGSSHGWLVTYNHSNGDLFLSEPPLRRHIKLPPFHTSSVANVILSCSPIYSRKDSRALMIYGPEKKLAFCCPCHDGTNWTPIGTDGANYQSFVYSTTKKVFFCIKKNDDDYLEAWDLRDPQSPRMVIQRNVFVDRPVAWRSEEEREKKLMCKTW